MSKFHVTITYISLVIMYSACMVVLHSHVNCIFKKWYGIFICTVAILRSVTAIAVSALPVSPAFSILIYSLCIYFMYVLKVQMNTTFFDHIEVQIQCFPYWRSRDIALAQMHKQLGIQFSMSLTLRCCLVLDE